MGFFSSLTGSNIGNATKSAIGQNGNLINDLNNTGNSIINTGETNSANALNSAVSGYAPYNANGQAANTMEANALGLNGADGNTAATSAFTASPGYTYNLDQSEKAAERGASAAGLLSSGNTLMALQSNASGLANQDYNSWLSNLSGLSGQGLTAASGQASADNSLASLYQGTANDRLGLASTITQGQEGLNNDLAQVKEQQAANKGSFLSSLLGTGAKVAGTALTAGLF